MISVVNIKTHEPTDSDIYIGRGSPLGNPYRINFRTTRDEAIARYEQYISENISSGNATIRAELNRIWKAAKVGDVNLVCFCKPEACHGDIIKKLIEEKL